jgi:hypothetical protein
VPPLLEELPRDERSSSRSRSRSADRLDDVRDDPDDGLADEDDAADLLGAFADRAFANDDAEPLKPIFGISGAVLPSASNYYNHPSTHTF